MLLKVVFRLRAAPSENSSTIIASGGSLNVAANNTNGNASYNLKWQ
jgi:hypothetical protein